MTAPLALPHVRQLRVSELDAKDLADWRALRATSPLYGSPLLSPEFATLIAGFREDVRVVLARGDDGALQAVLALHKRPLGFSRPLGTPFDDLSGPILAPGASIAPNALIAAAGLEAYRAETSICASSEPDDHSAFLIERSGQADAERLEACRAIHPKRFKNFRRLSRKMDTDLGGIALRWGAPDPARLRQLLAWKSAQFLDDGLVDITGATHSRQVLDAVAEMPSRDGQAFGGYMVELVCGERLLAGHFGVTLNGHFHPWISAYDPTLSDYAPGITLLYRLLEQFSETGLASYNLAGGHDHYKKYFAEPVIATRSLHLYAPSALGMAQGFGERVWNLVGARADTSAGARLRRRLDHIAACEPGLGARVNGVIYALKRRSPRG